MKKQQILKLKNELLKRYKIEPDGTIISKKTNKPIKFLNKGGYLGRVFYLPKLYTNKKFLYQHTIMAIIYLDYESNSNLQVNHKDGNKLNNDYSNLELVTASQNIKHYWDNSNTIERKLMMNLRRLSNGRFGKK